MTITKQKATGKADVWSHTRFIILASEGKSVGK